MIKSKTGKIIFIISSLMIVLIFLNLKFFEKKNVTQIKTPDLEDEV